MTDDPPRRIPFDMMDSATKRAIDEDTLKHHEVRRVQRRQFELEQMVDNIQLAVDEQKKLTDKLLAQKDVDHEQIEKLIRSDAELNGKINSLLAWKAEVEEEMRELDKFSERLERVEAQTLEP